MIRAFFFDLDGTLLDTEVLWVQALRAYLLAHGTACTPEEATVLVYGRSWNDIYAEIAQRFPHLATGIARVGAELRVGFQRLRAEFFITRDQIFPAIIVFSFVWNDYLWPMLVSFRQEWMTLPVGAAIFNPVGFQQTSSQYGYGTAMAVITVAALPTLAFFLGMQRYFIQGITREGLKG